VGECFLFSEPLGPGKERLASGRKEVLSGEREETFPSGTAEPILVGGIWV
jgi:hypothetical protein